MNEMDHTNDIVFHGQKERITRMNFYNMDTLILKMKLNTKGKPNTYVD